MHGPPLTGTPEIVCSLASGSGITAGGGFSASFSAPTFQKSAISSYVSKFTAKQSSYRPYNSSNRGYPDVALAADTYSKLIAILIWNNYECHDNTV